MQNLRVTENKEEIFSIFQSFRENGDKLLLWQTKNSKKEVCYGLVSIVTNEKIMITLDEGQKLDSFDLKATLYIHGSYRSVLFKQEMKHIDDSKVEVAMPTEIRVIERRLYTRYYYRYHNNIVKQIAFFCEELSGNGQSRIDKLSDISCSGCGIIVDTAKIGQYIIKNKIDILSISDQEIPKKLIGTIEHISPLQSDPQNKKLVGIKFDPPLKKINYTLVEEDQNKDNHSKGVAPEGQFYGLSKEEQVDILRKIELRDTALAVKIRENIDFFDRIQYMTVKMKQIFLRENDIEVIATAFRTLDQEIVMSLLSDISKNFKIDLLHYLKEPKSATAVSIAQQKIRDYIAEKEGSGEFFLNKESYNTVL